MEVPQLNELRDKYNKDAYLTKVIIEIEQQTFFEQMKNTVENDRFGEVCFAVKRSNNKTITVTSKEYPNRIFRIPTGGIGYNENIEEALFREIKEELGIGADIINFIGVINIVFKYNQYQIDFYSYIFLLKETTGCLLTDAIDDEVSEIFEADSHDLYNLSTRLKSLQDEWYDWGVFRSVTTKAIYDYLQTN